MKTTSLLQLCRSTIAVVLSATALLSSPSAEANSLLVNWGGDYVTSDRSSAATSVNLEHGIIYPYSDSVAKNPSNAAYSGTSSSFYGAVQSSTLSGPPGGGQFRVTNNGLNDRIHIRSQSGSATNPANVQGLLFWKKEDFLNQFNTAPSLNLSQLSELYVNLPDVRGAATIRFAVQMDNIWYLSKSALQGSGAGNALGEFSLGNPAGDDWAVWSVQTSPSGPLDPAPTVFDISGDTLTNITAVGIYFDSTYAFSNSAWVSIDSFSATAIPEPSHAALLGVSSLLLLGYGLRRGKSAQ